VKTCVDAARRLASGAGAGAAGKWRYIRDGDQVPAGAARVAVLVSHMLRLMAAMHNAHQAYGMQCSQPNNSRPSSAENAPAATNASRTSCPLPPAPSSTAAAHLKTAIINCTTTTHTHIQTHTHTHIQHPLPLT
jgi:hypothetical protein